MDWGAGEKNVCSAFDACPALRLLGTPSLPTRLLLGASPSARPESRFFATHDRIKKLRGLGGTCRKTSYSPRPSAHRWSGRMRAARPSKKNWTRKKRMASWARQRQQITEAADGGARARTGADGAVVLRRGPGAYAVLSRADGQLTRAGQHYYSHLGLRPPARTSTTTSPSSARGPTTTSCCATGGRSSCAPCRAESTG